MQSERINYYILFENYTQGLALYDLLKSKGLPARIAPTPRAIQGELSCGMSLLVQPEDIEAVRKCVEENNAPHHSIVPLECQIRPGRNRFC